MLLLRRRRYVDASAIEQSGTFKVHAELFNRGGGVLAWEVGSLPAWAAVTPANGILAAGEVAALAFTFTALPELAAGDYSAMAVLDTDGDEIGVLWESDPTGTISWARLGMTAPGHGWG